MASGFRFDPPRAALSAEVGWVLSRAFGPPSAPWNESGGIRGQRANEIAESFDLAERITARTAAALLVEEVGEAGFAVFQRASTGCVARALVVKQVCEEVSVVAKDLGVPVVFLKGAALHLGGWIESGSRSMSDVDVLVPDSSARRFQDALIAGGCRSPEAPEAEHQLQLLTHPTGLGIEVHRMIPGVRLSGGHSATADELLAGGLCGQAGGLTRVSLVPEHSVLSAHALVHGIAQHGLTPDTYPWSRFLADVQDLGAGGSGLREDLDTILPWIIRDVAPLEVEAVIDLIERLGRGEDPINVAAGDDHAALLIHHLVAGAVDDEYVRTMRLTRQLQGPSDKARWRRLVLDGWRTLWLTRPQVDKLYGKPKSALGYWGWRLWRPFDVVGRACGYGWAAGRHRFKRR